MSPLGRRYTMDEIVAQIGLKNNCTFCGVFRRQALDRGAVLLGANKIVTGHNADDIAETVFLNVLRGDFPRLTRCTNSITGEGGPLPRCKPFKYTYEKEIVMYVIRTCHSSPPPSLSLRPKKSVYQRTCERLGQMIEELRLTPNSLPLAFGGCGVDFAH